MTNPEPNQQRFEKYYPLTYAILITVASVVLCLWFTAVPKLSETILSSGITAAAIFIGFNAVYRNTLQAKASRTIQELKDSEEMVDYLRYLKAVTNSALLFILVSFILLFLPKAALEHILTFNVWLFFAINMLLSFHRANSLDNLLFASK